MLLSKGLNCLLRWVSKKREGKETKFTLKFLVTHFGCTYMITLQTLINSIIIKNKNCMSVINSLREEHGRINSTQVLEYRGGKVTRWWMGATPITDQQIKPNRGDQHLSDKLIKSCSLLMALLHWDEGARGEDREAVSEPVDQRRLLKRGDPSSIK